MLWIIYEVMSTREAEETWELGDGTVRKYCNQGVFTDMEARKSAGSWLITREGMARVFGDKKLQNSRYRE